MPVRLSKLQKMQSSPEEDAKHLAEFAQKIRESNEEYSKRYLPALTLQRPVEVNVTINQPSILAIIVIRDGE